MAKLSHTELKAGGFIPTETASEIVKETVRGSAVLSLADVQPMNAPTKKFPIQVDKAGAYWVGEGEKIGLSQGSWATAELVAKKLAVIVPVTKEAYNDSTIDIFEEHKEMIAEAFATKFDEAALFGKNSPFGSGASVFEKIGESKVTAGDNLADDVSDVMSLVEEDNFDVNAFIAPVAMKGKLRKIKDGDGTRLYKDVSVEGPAELYNQPIFVSRNGSFDTAKAQLIAGDFNWLKVGILDGIEYSIATEGTVGEYNLFEQDMVALKATMRIGFLVVKDTAFAALVPQSQV